MRFYTTKLLALSIMTMSTCLSYAQNDLNPVISKEVSDPAPDVPTNGISGTLHQKYIGKIVFTSDKDAIAFQKEVESGFTDKFTLGQIFYFRVYMANSLSNFVNRLYPDALRSTTDRWGVYMFKFYLDGSPILFTRMGGESTFDSEQKQKWTTWRGACNDPDESNPGVRTFKEFFATAQEKLTAGDHRIKIEIYPACRAPQDKTGAMIASGEFTLTVSGKSFDVNNAGMCLPKGKMQDKAVEAGMLKAYNNSGRGGIGKVARIVEPGWTIVRNKVTGIITHRIIDGIVASTKDGKCQYQVFGFSQIYDGTKFLDQVYLDNSSSTTSINCACLEN